MRKLLFCLPALGVSVFPLNSTEYYGYQQKHRGQHGLPSRLCIYHKQFHSVKFYVMNSDEKVFVKCINPIGNTPAQAYNVNITRKTQSKRGALHWECLLISLGSDPDD